MKKENLTNKRTTCILYEKVPIKNLNNVTHNLHQLKSAKNLHYIQRIQFGFKNGKIIYSERITVLSM
jgi:hypothetical protein